ncbi:hypothetical protein NMY22_g19252 [Coprinellus aureogranulatus]|nr:hypothetical protein NMY22_g19252 [Coprinellus aureogranulatus]
MQRANKRSPMERANASPPSPASPRNETPALDRRRWRKRANTNTNMPSWRRVNGVRSGGMPSWKREFGPTNRRGVERKDGRGEENRGILGRRAEGSGGNDGVVLEMEMVGGGVYDVDPSFVELASLRRLGLFVTAFRRTFVLSSFRPAFPAVVLLVLLTPSSIPSFIDCVQAIIHAAYVLPVTVGRDSKQTFSVQVDTGSSDLVPRKYDPRASGSTSTGVDFSIQYLQGQVDGPVVWDRVNVGGYEVENQAIGMSHSSSFAEVVPLTIVPSPHLLSITPFLRPRTLHVSLAIVYLPTTTPTAAGTNIQSEPLSPQFAGILGLALPLNSVIAQALPPVMSNDPDGAAWASNLFGITPYSNAPMQRFIGMLLERPGSDRIPSLLGIGRHPSIVSSRVVPSAEDANGGVEYSTLVSERTGTLFWKTSVRAITVYKDGEKLEVDVGRGVMGSVFPSAVLDSGVPLILASGRIANGVWGALGISPSADGMYYIPCTTPLNMTITLDDRTPIPLHPLDLTSPPETSHSPVSSSDAMCVGLLQAADAYLGRPNSIGDMILGVPFLRNVYSVMAYAAPKDDGTFERPWPEGATGEEEVEDPDTNSTTPNPTRPGNVMPRLGLMSMTDPTIALEEFKTVRVLNQPISNGTHSGGSANTSRDGGSGRHGLSVGIIVLIALVGFFAVCFALFALRWFLIRRKYGKGGSGSVPASGRNTPLPWNGFGLGGGGGGADGSNSALSADASDEAKLAKMLGAGIGGVGLGGGGYVGSEGVEWGEEGSVSVSG